MSAKYASLKLVKVENLGDFVYKVSLNRPSKFNALNMEIWKWAPLSSLHPHTFREIGDCFQWIDEDPDCRVAILQGEGKHFCAGLDLNGAKSYSSHEPNCCSRSGPSQRGWRRKCRSGQKEQSHVSNDQVHAETVHLYRWVLEASDPRDARILSRSCHWHRHCLWHPLRYKRCCTFREGSRHRNGRRRGNTEPSAESGWKPQLDQGDLPFGTPLLSWRSTSIWSVKCDVSSLSLLCLGLLSRVFDTREEMLLEVQKLAKLISSKSPIGVQGTKHILNYARENTVENSLNYVVGLGDSEFQDLLRFRQLGTCPSWWLKTWWRQEWRLSRNSLSHHSRNSDIIKLFIMRKREKW